VLKFPQLSVARHVRLITLLSVQLPRTLTSVYVITGFAVQLSVAVANPVLAGSVDSVQLIVTFAGHVITGCVTSRKVMVCKHVLKFPQLSVALHVRVITKLFMQLPGVEISV